MTASSAGDTPPDGPGSESRGSSATVWMAAAAVLVLAAIALAVYAFTAKSDLDDANATLDRANAAIARQDRQLAREERGAGSEEASLRGFGERERAAFRRVRRRFVRAEAKAAALKKTIDKESAELDRARSRASSAEGQEQREQTALNAAQQETQLSQACVQGAVVAIDRYFNASTARAGRSGVVKELESIQEQCKSAK